MQLRIYKSYVFHHLPRSALFYLQAIIIAVGIHTCSGVYIQSRERKLSYNYRSRITPRAKKISVWNSARGVDCQRGKATA